MLWSRTVPEYIDRSDDVAWMLGCSLILLTIQVLSSHKKAKATWESVKRANIKSSDWAWSDGKRNVFAQE